MYDNKPQPNPLACTIKAHSKNLTNPVRNFPTSGTNQIKKHTGFACSSKRLYYGIQKYPSVGNEP